MRLIGFALRQLFVIVAIAWCGVAAGFALIFIPEAGTQQEGVPFDINVAVSGLESGGQILSAFDFDIVFDPAQLAFVRAAPGDAICLAADCATDALTSFISSLAIGSVNLFALSAASDSELAGQQSNLFTIATLTFTPLLVADDVTVGFGPINALSGSIDALGNATDLSPLLSPSPPASLAIFDITPRGIPEPGTLALMAGAVLLLTVCRFCEKKLTARS